MVVLLRAGADRTQRGMCARGQHASRSTIYRNALVKGLYNGKHQAAARRTMSNTQNPQDNEPARTRALPELVPPDYCDPVIEAYKKDVDRTLLRESLKLSVEERIRRAQQFHETLEELRRSGEEARAQS